MTDSPAGWLSTEEAADYLGVAPNTLRTWRFRSKVEPVGPPSYAIGASIRYRVADLDAWVATRVRGELVTAVEGR
jgi:hypothetical protein